MSTKIEWTEETWNPVTGCSKVSPGCDHCYAERMSKRLRGRLGYSDDEPFKVTLHPDKLNRPLRWRKPRRVFVCSMGDLFHGGVPIDYIINIFLVMAESPQHTFQVLTKRPDGMLSLQEVLEKEMLELKHQWPLPNVWLGVTAEDQQRADERIPLLLLCSAAVRFVSCEPLLGPIDLRDQPFRDGCGVDAMHPADPMMSLDWVIVGGETGPGARQMHPMWARFLRDQCVAADVPFFSNVGAGGLRVSDQYQVLTLAETSTGAHGTRCLGAVMSDDAAHHLAALARATGCTAELRAMLRSGSPPRAGEEVSQWRDGEKGSEHLAPTRIDVDGVSSSSVQMARELLKSVGHGAKHKR